MKNLILGLLLLFLFGKLYSQQYDETSLTSLRKQISESFQRLITRDDDVSLEIINVFFAADNKSKYALDIQVNFYSQEVGQLKELALAKNLIVKQLIDNKEGDNTNFVGGNYYDVFGITSLENYQEIQIEIGLTKIDEGENGENLFSKFGPLLDKVDPTNGTITTVFRILGIDKDSYEQNQRRLVSRGTFYIPLNFVEYGFDDRGDRPYLLNNETFSIPFKINNELDNPDNLKKLGTNILNQITKWVYGDKVIKPESENICGAITLQFTKDKNSNYPKNLISTVEKFSEDIAAGDYSAKEAISEADKILEEIERIRGERKMTKRMYDNLRFYILLSKRYISFTNLYSLDFNLKDYNKVFIGDFNKWYLYADRVATQWGYKRFGLTELYDDYEEGNRRDRIEYKRLAKIFLPYSLTNKLILHSIDIWFRWT